jgi:hypothetical protein
MLRHPRTLRSLRVLWGVLLAIQGCLLAIVLAMPSSARPYQPAVSALALALSPIAVALGYLIRNQTYKRHWQGDVITARGYFLGNLMLFAMCVLAGVVGAVDAWARGRWPAMVGSALALVVMGINFPHGEPMVGQGPTGT